MKRAYLYRCVMLGLLSGAMSAQAQQASQSDESEVINLPPITIFGNKINGVDNTLSNVDVINTETLRDPAVNNIRAALKYNPALAVSSQNGVLRDIRIRGMGQNYTELTIDGEKAPEYYLNGPFSSGERGIYELNTIRQIDVIKGLHSPKQSTDALAGTVNLRTYDPSDFVDKNDPIFFSIGSGYTSKNKGWSTTLKAAGTTGNFSGLAIYTHRKEHELSNMGSAANGTLPDDQDIKKDNILVKGEANFDGGKILLTAEKYADKQKDTPRDAKQLKTFGAYTSPTDRMRLSVAGAFDNALGFDELQVKLAYQRYEQTNRLASFAQSYVPPYIPGPKTWINQYKQNSTSLKFDATKQIDTAWAKHNVLLGLGSVVN